MIAPEVVLVRRYEWSRTQEVFEIRGGDIAPDWADGLRSPRAPWCSITVWDEHHVTGYGGEVWPMAWPELFRLEGLPGRQRHIMTAAGIAARAAASAASPEPS